MLEDIRKYNQDDCDSTLEGVLWLRNIAHAGRRHKVDVVADEGATAVEEDTVTESTEVEEEDIGMLLQECGGLDLQARELMAGAVEYERRELKPMWWRKFAWMQASDLELESDTDVMSLTLVPRNSKHFVEPSVDKHTLN